MDYTFTLVMFHFVVDVVMSQEKGCWPELLGGEKAKLELLQPDIQAIIVAYVPYPSIVSYLLVIKTRYDGGHCMGMRRYRFV